MPEAPEATAADSARSAAAGLLRLLKDVAAAAIVTTCRSRSTSLSGVWCQPRRRMPYCQQALRNVLLVIGLDSSRSPRSKFAICIMPSQRRRQAATRAIQIHPPPARDRFFSDPLFLPVCPAFLPMTVLSLICSHTITTASGEPPL